MLESISEFYINVFADLATDLTVPSEPAVRYQPFNRFGFAITPGLCTGLLIEKVIKTSFDLIKCIFTLFLDVKITESFKKNARLIPVIACAIPIGLFGIFFPKSVNGMILGIPENGLRKVYT